MLIKKLNATTDAITQAALVSISRERARQAVSKMVCPNKLLSYSARLYRISKEHPAANSLQREAELATQKAIEIRSRPEYVAWTVIEDGCSFFKSNEIGRAHV